MKQHQCELIVTSVDFIEVAIILSYNTDPVWFSRSYKSLDEHISIVQNLITFSNALHLFDNSAGASMTFETTFGALNIRSIDPESVLALFLIDGFSLRTIDLKLKNILADHP
jgi:hypothetical protein